MRIDVTGKGYSVSDRVREHAEEKSEKLTRVFDRTQQIRFTIEKHEKHEKSTYDVECIVDVEKHDDFVASASTNDPISAIDESVNKAARQLSDFKERLKTEHR